MTAGTYFGQVTKYKSLTCHKIRGNIIYFLHRALQFSPVKKGNDMDAERKDKLEEV